MRIPSRILQGRRKTIREEEEERTELNFTQETHRVRMGVSGNPVETLADPIGKLGPESINSDHHRVVSIPVYQTCLFLNNYHAIY